MATHENHDLADDESGIPLGGRVMTDAVAIHDFAFAGKATLTLKSLATGKHYTYRIDKAKKKRDSDKDVWFVNVLADADQYFYVGIIGTPRAFRLTVKSKFSDDAPSVKAFRFFFDHTLVRGTIPATLEVRHEGTCGRCARQLTHPDSIDRGIGPICMGLMGLN